MLLLSFLQTQYHYSRRKIVDLIKEKKILINNSPIESFKYELMSSDTVKILGDIETKFEQKNEIKKDEILLFNKPVGYVVSKSDKHNQTIYQLLPVEFQHRYYIGRLDKESRGLVLLTPNPAVVHQFEHPSYEVSKEYLVKVSRILKALEIKQTKNGILSVSELGKKDLLKFQNISQIKNANIYKIILNEGKKRHIRRVFSALGIEVIDLQRIKEGKFELGNMKEGEYKLMDM
ncbi:pseudouridine synthase [candidate division SR1 bacterium]|nr:pseudouridine synthase [candidate division SR1 bacterium]